MIWRKQPEPKIGDKRVVARFAWFPTAVGAYWVWLDTYYALEFFEEYEVNDLPYPHTEYGWCEHSRSFSSDAFAEALES